MERSTHVVDVGGASPLARDLPLLIAFAVLAAYTYLHLGRFDGRWLIINALYVRHDT